MVGTDVYYLINESKIIQFAFCDICDSKLYIDTANYKYSNDTLEFSLRNDILCKNDSVHFKWVYYDRGVGFFSDIEYGDCIRVNTKLFNEMLKPFGIMLAP